MSSVNISLKKAVVSDAEAIFDMQIEAFLPLLAKYRDFATNPANETIERVIRRIANPSGGFYKIMADRKLAGAICVYWKEDGLRFWISPMFLHPQYQGQGIAQQSIAGIFDMFPQAASWELATIAEEERNCYLYEKMGFRRTGVQKALNERATLVYYVRGG
ncbi:Acetyltransferase (GNAT) family protein [Paenibacillus konkukensis]|uniref:Acetyltransferase (GNAT) family protein n=1 Tax=Paenibacillus konkukensis TaxID=2020716 RepID=A0ABY4RKM7_9BACL|nr:GNAT family N-acetyltransferase [Paenibacillus konkukensis]UQZ82174.1 Acetyltransferase (GNAT) family protein [Paenibacillus konkukensis]